MILGEVLAPIGGKPLDTLLSEEVLGPMGRTGTSRSQTSAVPGPGNDSGSASSISRSVATLVAPDDAPPSPSG